MTTDTFPKAATRTAQIGGHEVRITGIAKGSGMIAPDMATMLCFVFTDAKIPAAALQTLLKQGVDRQLQLHDGGFRHLHLRHRAAVRHRAGEASAHAAPRAAPMLRDFARALDEVLMDLALQVVRDGEGAQKLVRIDVTGAVDRAVGQADGDGGGQLAAGEDGDRRRGRQLGPHRHGGRQGRRAGRPRPAVDRRRRGVDGARRRAWCRATTRRRSSRT